MSTPYTRLADKADSLYMATASMRRCASRLHLGATIRDQATIHAYADIHAYAVIYWQKYQCLMDAIDGHRRALRHRGIYAAGSE